MTEATTRLLVEAIQDGLPLVSRPFLAVATEAGVSEAAVIEQVSEWLESGVIKRFGLVVRHHELGYRANAMAVWDIPDEVVGAVGQRAGGYPFVTLCYRRERHLPEWPYNLYCMVHGRDREAVTRQLEQLNRELELEAYPHTVLFSTRRLKQRGARYAHGRR